MKLTKKIIQRIITILNLFGIDYRISPVIDTTPTEGSNNAVSSGGTYTALEDLRNTVVAAKSDIPIQSSSKYFTAGGAYADKTDGCVAGNTKNFTSGGAFKYLRWLAVQLNPVASWTAVSVNGAVESFAFNNGTWVAASGGGLLVSANNGVTWTLCATPQSYMRRVTYFNGLWVAAAYNDTNGLWWSQDGYNWNRCSVSISSRNNDYGDVWHAGDFWYACYSYGDGSEYGLRSVDGKTWVSSATMSIIVYNNGLYVGSNFSTHGRLFWSTDGINWQMGYDPDIYRYRFKSIKCNGSLWVASASDGYTQSHVDRSGRLVWSDDGKTWHQCTTDAPSGLLSFDVQAFGNGVWVASYQKDYGSTSYQAGMLYSEDGKEWHTCLNVPLAVTFANGIFMGYADSSVYYSFDGKVWISRETGVSVSHDGIITVYANGVWLLGSYYKADIVWHKAVPIDIPPSLPD